VSASLSLDLAAAPKALRVPIESSAVSQAEVSAVSRSAPLVSLSMVDAWVASAVPLSLSVSASAGWLRFSSLDPALLYRRVGRATRQRVGGDLQLVVVGVCRRRYRAVQRGAGADGAVRRRQCRWGRWS